MGPDLNGGISLRVPATDVLRTKRPARRSPSVKLGGRDMTGKPQFDQNKQGQPGQQQQGGNLGQQDARQEKKKESDLSRMGEMSREKKEEQNRR
jgi:hypothetical protein